jgi:hypothetical protein
MGCRIKGTYRYCGKNELVECTTRPLSGTALGVPLNNGEILI